VFRRGQGTKKTKYLVRFNTTNDIDWNERLATSSLTVFETLVRDEAFDRYAAAASKLGEDIQSKREKTRLAIM
jgi:hypothetical protein